MINYYLITKPGIVLGNLITVAAGFLLASKGNIDFYLFSAVMLGLTLIMASACIFNNYIDRHLDQKMARTKSRPFATNAISTPLALMLATGLVCLGNMVLWSSTNVLTVFIADAGFIIYVILYSLWKSRTIYGTAIGSIAGAVPPLVGYCAVSNQFDLGALILFAMLVFWQMPHFFSIAVFRIEDYTHAKIPVLPIKRGMLQTKLRMLFYIIAFLFTSLLLTIFGYTGYLYFSLTLLISLAWLGLCASGFTRADNQKWGHEMFRLSLILIGIISLAIPFDLK